MKQGKIWGIDDGIFDNGMVKVHYIDIKKGGFSSEHDHKYWSNKFYVISGELEISLWTEEGFCDKTILKEGQSTNVPSGVFHKFYALTDVRCIEIYEIRFHGEDINRKTKGGIDS